MGGLNELLRRRRPRLPGVSPPTERATSAVEPNMASTLKSEGSPTVDLLALEVLATDICAEACRALLPTLRAPATPWEQKADAALELEKAEDEEGDKEDPCRISEETRLRVDLLRPPSGAARSRSRSRSRC